MLSVLVKGGTSESSPTPEFKLSGMQSVPKSGLISYRGEKKMKHLISYSGYRDVKYTWS